jgi:catechol 2,3-dioxygenase-like lactoylglutathione lyase family enzyme
MTIVQTLSRIELISSDLAQLAAFYHTLGFTVSETPPPQAMEPVRLALALGHERVDLVRPLNPGAPYPAVVPGWNLQFQHFAIVVSDMAQAYARLQRTVGWTAISLNGPQRLPDTSGGVTAFKFRDPEGHPLEFIAFPTGRWPDRWRRASGVDLFLGIDHSAISVADTRRSQRFYETLGLVLSASSFNIGCEQARLDNIVEPRLSVTTLTTAGHAAPHLELLCYHGEFPRTAPPPADSIAATRLVFRLAATGKSAEATLRDPDGHTIVLERRGDYSGST